MNPFRPARLGHHVRQTFAFRPNELSAWQGARFAVDIGVPALVGLLIQKPELGFIGALAGSFLALGDTSTPLPDQLRRLLQMFLAIVSLGVWGVLVGAHSMLFWVSLVGLSFATAALQLSNHAGASPIRFGAISLVSTAFLPGASWSLVGMVSFAALVGAATRVFEARFFPESAPILPLLTSDRTFSLPQTLRFCSVFALAVALSLLIGERRGATHPMWIATTVLLVLQNDWRSSLARLVQRVTGTAIGVGAAAATIALFHSSWGLFAAVVALGFVLPFAATRNYWLQSALYAWLILVLYDFASTAHFNPLLLGERILDVAVGCAIGLVATVAAFVPLLPNKLKPSH